MLREIRIHLKPALLAGLALSASLLACQVNLGGSTPPAPTMEVSQDAAGDLEWEWRSALDQAEAANGRLVLVLTEKELTSYVNLALAERQDPILEQAQIFLREGVMQVHGVVEQGLLKGNVYFEIVPMLTPDGTLTFEISSAELGPFPMPDSVRDNISSLVSEGFTGSIGSYASGFKLESVDIEDGEMAITGLIR